jgi:hypothetical protein
MTYPTLRELLHFITVVISRKGDPYKITHVKMGYIVSLHSSSDKIYNSQINVEVLIWTN